jgi:hypothetical protein
MNKLCISKLLQVIADELVPSDFERRDDEEPRAATSQPAAQPMPTLRPIPAMAATVPMTGFTPPASAPHSPLGHLPTAPTAGPF